MNLPRDRDHDLERLLGEEGGEFGVLYRRLSQVDPPRRLDRAVLGEAARAVRGRVPRGQRWVVGLGSAAGLVLAAGIAWQVGHEALREPSIHPTHDHAPMVVPVAPITEHSVRQPVQAIEAQNAKVPSADVPTATTSPPPVVAQKPRAATKPVAPAATRLPPPQSSPAPAPPPAAFPAEAESLHEEQRAPAATAAAPVDAMGAAKADAAGTMQKEPAPRMRRSAPPAPSSSIELRRDLQLAPSAWIAHVRDLLEHGRRQQAIESLLLFRRTHPDHSIPDDLRPLLD